MNKLLDLFSSDSNEIEIHGIDGLARLCKYHPHKTDQFFNGLELAADLASNDGVTLYTSGTTISPDRIQRLINLQENNPNMEMKFKLKRSAALINNFKTDITKKLNRLVEFRTNYKVYANLIGSIEQNLETFIEDLLTDEDIVLNIYKMKFIVDSSENKNSTLYFNHTVSIAIFAYAIAKSPYLSEAVEFSADELKELIKASFFHNIGSILNIDNIVSVEEGEREKRYNEYNRNSGSFLGNVKFSFDGMDAVRYSCEYHAGNTDFVLREDNKGCWMANIIVIADKYVRHESGLFGKKYKPSHIIDQLNVLSVNKKLNDKVVKALTQALNLKDIFDFYMEMESLKAMCTFKGGNHTWPYPMTGFKSPTIFVCRDSVKECDHYEKSLSAVNLLKPEGGLNEGKYARCLLTTPKLLEFYAKHYEEIKDDLKKPGVSSEKK